LDANGNGNANANGNDSMFQGTSVAYYIFVRSDGNESSENMFFVARFVIFFTYLFIFFAYLYFNKRLKPIMGRSPDFPGPFPGGIENGGANANAALGESTVTSNVNASVVKGVNCMKQDAQDYGLPPAFVKEVLVKEDVRDYGLPARGQSLGIIDSNGNTVNDTYNMPNTGTGSPSRKI
jgi:hypothetical protein